MINIFTRSPFIVEIDEAGQLSTTVKLYIWNNGASQPTDPTYTLTKLIPSSNVTATYYDVSNYIREFISFNKVNDGTYPSFPTNIGNSERTQFTNVIIERYKNTGAGDVLVDTTTYLAFDGYTPYENGSNYDYGDIHLAEGTYYYYDDGQGALGNLEYDRAVTSVRVLEDALQLTAYYTNLDTAATYSEAILAEPSNVPLIYKNYYGNSVRLEIKDASLNVLATYVSVPVTDCKYTVNRIDFVNKYGAYQREFFFGASYDYVDSTSKEFMNKQTSLSNYSTNEGQMKEFNINGVKRIKVNTGWVEENYKETIEEMLMSEKILVNGYPAKLTTKNVEKYKNINTKQINYELDFTYNYQLINSVS